MLTVTLTREKQNEHQEIADDRCQMSDCLESDLRVGQLLNLRFDLSQRQDRVHLPQEEVNAWQGYEDGDEPSLRGSDFFIGYDDECEC